jgi:hypothetical protein
VAELVAGAWCTATTSRGPTARRRPDGSRQPRAARRIGVPNRRPPVHRCAEPRVVRPPVRRTARQPSIPARIDTQAAARRARPASGCGSAARATMESCGSTPPAGAPARHGARVAELARIDLRPDEVSRRAGELDVIVESVAPLSPISKVCLEGLPGASVPDLEPGAAAPDLPVRSTCRSCWVRA